MAVPAPNDQWFAVHVLSGQENKVRENIKRRMISEEMTEYVFQVLVPTERVSEVRGGKKMETNRKIYPGYVIVNMHLLEEDGGMVDRTWYFVQETPGVIKFAGTKDKPMSMRKREVESMLSQITEQEGAVKPKIAFEVGDSVRVADGPFEGQNGIVEEIDPEAGKLRVAVTIFGRSQPVEIGYWQVEKG